MSQMEALGYSFVLAVIPLAASASVRGLPFIAGFRYSGLIWVGQVIFGSILALLAYRRIRFPLLRWAPFTIYMFLSLFWVESLTGQHLQDAFQIAAPVLLGALASVFLTSDRALRRLRVSAFLSGLLLVAITLMIGMGRSGPTINDRTMPMTAVLLACVAVSSYPVARLRAVLGWATCLGLTFATGARTATFLVVFLWLFRPGRLGSRRTTALVVSLAVALAVFYTPAFQDRFFPEGGSGTVEDLASGELTGTGRFEVWPKLWKEARKTLLQGVGVGETNYVIPRFWKNMQLAHNDYLRILLELGVIGLFCFMGAMALHLREAGRLFRSTSGELQVAWSTAYLGLIAFLVLAITDNPLIYGVWFGSPLFVYIGAAHGRTAALRSS
jgi:O-antigen ligase